ncbi:MAG: tRNA pseudouridine(55) synthase TruB [Candidatus Omnitrophica bacterium]|nr:tRNA pseudouridine(55) synthase TruB [Candidatus Omnitrophota bacterium]
MDGIFVINKPAGITSHDVVDAIRRRFNTKRVGHAGTLDPMATGVLVILVGKATKLSDSFMQRDKEYVATLFLGKSTDTQDSTGKTLETRPLNGIEAGLVRKTLNSFLGEIEQIPPMVSAKKYKGKKLYELARKGKSVPRKPCMIKIHEIELLSFNLPEFVFRVKCSKGTYVRTLCESIGKAMGYPAHMSGLVRTMSGEFGLKEAKELDAASEKDLRAV